jgi:hypothetical protein
MPPGCSYRLIGFSKLLYGISEIRVSADADALQLKHSRQINSTSSSGIYFWSMSETTRTKHSEIVTLSSVITSERNPA